MPLLDRESREGKGYVLGTLSLPFLRQEQQTSQMGWDMICEGHEELTFIFSKDWQFWEYLKQSNHFFCRNRSLLLHFSIMTISSH